MDDLVRRFQINDVGLFQQGVLGGSETCNSALDRFRLAPPQEGRD
ncbi:hypothetical protein ABZ650_23260 [Streptomyces griseoviridis]